MNEPTSTQSVSEPAKRGTESILAILALVFGIMSLCGFIYTYAGIPLGLLALVLGYFGRRSAERKSLATIGMVLGGVGVLLSCYMVSFVIVMLLLDP